MGEVLAALFGGSVLLVWATGFVIYLLLFGFLPLMAWQALRALKGIHRELKRFNDTGAGGSYPRDGEGVSLR